MARASRSFGAQKFRRNTWYHPGESQRVLVTSCWWVGGSGESPLGAKTLKNKRVFKVLGNPGMHPCRGMQGLLARTGYEKGGWELVVGRCGLAGGLEARRLRLRSENLEKAFVFQRV